MNYSRFTKAKLVEIIEKLSHDSAFGILTRTGLEMRMKGSYDCLFIDFKDVHYLNHSLGYHVVNYRIKMILEEVKLPGVLVGRLFSGDEIVVLVKSNQYDTSFIEKRISVESFFMGMSYKYKFFKSIKSLDEIK